MDLKPLTDAIAKGNRVEATKLTKAALDSGMKPQDIVEKGLVPAERGVCAGDAHRGSRDEGIDGVP
jgi:methanogenic corrinoid protein MtbC1